MWFFFNFIIYIRGSCCDYLPQVPKNIAMPLLTASLKNEQAQHTTHKMPAPGPTSMLDTTQFYRDNSIIYALCMIISRVMKLRKGGGNGM